MTAWRSLSLSDVATIERVGIEPQSVPGDTPYIGLENIERGGQVINVSNASDSRIDSLKYQFTENHLLYGKLRPYLAKIARPRFAGICSTDLLPILPGPNLDLRYLHHFLSQPSMVELATARSTGANLPRLAPKELARFAIPIPPLDEQRRIAEVLDRVDALRAKRRRSIVLVDDLAQSIFLDMFGSVEADWPSVTVQEIAAPHKNSIRTGPFGSQLLHDEFVDEGIAVLGIDNAVTNEFQWTGKRFITEQKYKELTRYTVHPGDVIITIMGTCGRCAIVPDDIPTTINTKHLCCITLDQARCLPEFLHAAFLYHPEARKYLHRTAKGAVMAGLNMSIIKSLPLRLPPLDDQMQFSRRLASVRALKIKHSSSLSELDELFSSVQQRAFRGELWGNLDT